MEDHEREVYNRIFEYFEKKEEKAHQQRLEYVKIIAREVSKPLMEVLVSKLLHKDPLDGLLKKNVVEGTEFAKIPIPTPEELERMIKLMSRGAPNVNEEDKTNEDLK